MKERVCLSHDVCLSGNTTQVTSRKAGPVLVLYWPATTHAEMESVRQQSLDYETI